MKDSLYGMICSFLFGLGQLCMFTGFDTQSFVVEPVLHSVHDRDPSRIDGHAGFYGQAVICAFYTFANLFSPCLLNYVSSKTVLVVGSALFTVYLAGFLFVNSWFFYISCAALGFGFAMFYTGHGGYLTEHSTRDTIERNSAIIWAVGTACMIVGGIVMLFTTKTTNAEINDFNTTIIDSHNGTAVHSSYREYSDEEIRYLFGAFAIISLVSNIIFAVIPSRHVNNNLADLAKATTGEQSFRGQMELMWEALCHPRILLLAPLFAFIGVNTSLWIAVYPTSLAFTKSLSHHVYLPALYSIVLGTGDMLMSLLISVMAKPIPSFGQKPTMVMAVVLSFITYGLILATTPAQSTRIPNDDPALFMEPTALSCLAIAFLFGLGDSCLNTARTIMCALALPKKRAQAFAISKFYQSLFGTIIMFASPFLSVYFYIVFLSIGIIITAVAFFMVVDQTQHMEKKMSRVVPDALHPSTLFVEQKKKSTVIPYIRKKEDCSTDNTSVSSGSAA